jgi:uncharacterized membrane protein
MTKRGEKNNLIKKRVYHHLVGVAALLLAAVLGPAGVAGVALAADHLVLAVLERELEEVEVDLGVAAALSAAAAEAEHQVQRRLLLDVVVGQGPLVLQLLPGEDKPLLVRRDPCNYCILCSRLLLNIIGSRSLQAQILIDYTMFVGYGTETK